MKFKIFWWGGIHPSNRKRINWGLIKLKERCYLIHQKNCQKLYLPGGNSFSLSPLLRSVRISPRLDLLSACSWGLYSKRVISNKPIYNHFATSLLTFEKQIRRKSALKWFEAKKSEVRQVRSNARRWFLGKFFCYGFRREKFSSLNPNLNTARLKVERKIYHAAKYNSFLFCFVLDRTWGELLGSKLTGNMAGKGNRKEVQVSFCFSFLFFFLTESLVWI